MAAPMPLCSAGIPITMCQGCDPAECFLVRQRSTSMSTLQAQADALRIGDKVRVTYISMDGVEWTVEGLIRSYKNSDRSPVRFVGNTVLVRNDGKVHPNVASIEVLERALPPEPDHAAILEDAAGQLWRWSGDSGHGYWYRQTLTAISRDWRELVNEGFGPFQVYTRSGQIS